VESAILIVAALGALGAFSAGIVLLALYMRASRRSDYYDDEPEVYGNLVQCQHCGYMNPITSGVCLNCRRPLPRPRGYEPPPISRHPTQVPGSPYSPAPPAPAPPPAVSSPPAARVTATNAAAPRPPAPQPPPVVIAAQGERPPDMPQAWLEGIGGAMMGHRAVLAKHDTLIGRSTTCDVQIFDPKVSRKHMLIRFGNGAFFAQDQESSRGTVVNGERVMAQRLHDGDRIDLGDTSLIFHVDER